MGGVASASGIVRKGWRQLLEQKTCPFLVAQHCCHRPSTTSCNRTPPPSALNPLFCLPSCHALSQAHRQSPWSLADKMSFSSSPVWRWLLHSPLPLALARHLQLPPRGQVQWRWLPQLPEA